MKNPMKFRINSIPLHVKPDEKSHKNQVHSILHHTINPIFLIPDQIPGFIAISPFFQRT